MTRVSSRSPSASSVATRAGERFQLPPRTERRTQGSTLFSTTAKNLISSVPFRWRDDQVKIFEDWVLFKGPNVMSADLLPLLGALDLDGYEDIQNHRGECVHELIIVKVRRKLTRTKKDMDIKDQKKTAYGTSQGTIHTRHGDAGSVVSPHTNVHGQIKQSAFIDDNGTVVKREEVDEFELPRQSIGVGTNRTMPGGRYDEPSAAPNTGPAPGQISRPSTYQNMSPMSTSRKDNGTTMSNSRSACMASETVEEGLEEQMGGIKCQYGSRSQVVATRSRKDKDLLVGLAKLKAAIREFSVAVGQLPADTEAAGLETAAHDTKLEVEHLGDLVKEYVQN
ncbi:hypothetical protein F4859DRAFT_529716 [Xylaria cf. heliscus]|nr:hypothetical protein F4859DRAFT_529716 [Xylaria cf. heliscus]